MNRKDIIRMAREADEGFEKGTFYAESLVGMNAIERFAALVAAHEREACAKVCERYWSAASLESDRTATAIASAIRSRGEVKS